MKKLIIFLSLICSLHLFSNEQSKCLSNPQGFKACKIIHSNYINLRVEYRGFLKNTAISSRNVIAVLNPLKIFVKLNGLYEEFPLNNYEVDLSIESKTYAFIIITNSLEDYKLNPTTKMFAPSFLERAIDLEGRIDNWYIEAAVSDISNRWDSNFGNNYHFQL